MDDTMAEGRIEHAITYATEKSATPLGLRVPEPLYSRLVAYARRTRRTLANAALVLVEQALTLAETPPPSPAVPPQDAGSSAHPA